MIKNPQAVLDIIADIRRKRAEQEVLLRKLEFQAKLALQGIDVENLHHTEYDRGVDKRGPGVKRPACYNVAVMKDGRRVVLNPVLS